MRILQSGLALFTFGLMYSASAGENFTYSYDALGRISAVCYLDSGKTISYSYDKAGNRSSVVTATAVCGSAPPPPGNNNPPNAVNDVASGLYFEFDTASINVLTNDTDPDGDALTVTNATCSPGCSVTVSSGRYVNITGTTYGTRTATYTISDGRGGTDTATATATFQREPTCGPVLC